MAPPLNPATGQPLSRDDMAVTMFGLFGHGHFDPASYEKYFADKREDDLVVRGQLDRAAASVPRLAGVAS